MSLMPNYGWVQNTSNLGTIHDTVSLIPEFGITHLELRAKIKQQRIQMGNLTKRWDYDARCRIRAVVALGFAILDRNIQGYALTPLGAKLQRAARNPPRGGRSEGKYRELTSEEIIIFKSGLLTNPPVIRVLEILNEARRTGGRSLTKYDVGSQLGYVGDEGFTHIDPEWVLANGYSFNNKEGDSDKWARTILSWLVQVGWASALEAGREVVSGPGALLVSYSATPEVERVLRYDVRSSEKYVPAEMLCSDKHPMRELIIQRRTKLLQILKNRSSISLTDLYSQIYRELPSVTESVIKLDIKNLQQAGLRIVEEHSNYRLIDTINLSPLATSGTTPAPTDLNLEQIVADLTERFNLIPIRIVDGMYRYSRDPNKDAEFESIVGEYFHFLGYTVRQLGSTMSGQRVADCIAKYIDDTQYRRSYGIIVDAKATRDIYTFPVADTRKMKEYINTHGAELLAERIPTHYYMFISSKIQDDCQAKLAEIREGTDADGSAIDVETALNLAQKIKVSNIKLGALKQLYSKNRKLVIEDIQQLTGSVGQS